MKAILAIIIGAVLLLSCTRPVEQIDLVVKNDFDTVFNENINIMISPDLSNRITEQYVRPLNDVDIIQSILDMYYSFVYKSGGRVIGQSDKISIQITNSQLMRTYGINSEPLEINLAELNNEERIRYLTDSLQAESYYKDKIELINEIIKVYNTAKNNTVGADIYDLFKSRLNSDIILADEQPKESFENTIINKNRNLLILITDGYIEAGMYGTPAEGNLYYHLDNDVIKRFREEFLASGEKDMKKFFEKEGYGLMPIENKVLENLEVFAIEFYDRTLLRESGNNTVFPDDYDITKLFWEDWMYKSGVKRFKVYEKFATINEFERAFKNFILNS